MDYTDDTDSQDMGCAQIKSVESVKSVGHEKCWGVKGHRWHGCPQADGGG